MELRLDSTVVRSDEIMAQAVDDELVMMALETSRYYGLNPMGRRIWEMLENPAKIADVCAQLVREYDVTDEQCATEVLAFLGELQRGATIRVVT